MALIKQRILKSVEALPQQQSVNVRWADQVLENGVVISEQFHRRAYSQAEYAAFVADVPGGKAVVDPVLQDATKLENVMLAADLVAAHSLVAAQVAQIENLTAEHAAAQAQVAELSVALPVEQTEEEAIESEVAARVAALQREDEIQRRVQERLTLAAQ